MPVDAKTKYKAKKIKIVFFDIDDTLRAVSYTHLDVYKRQV